ncbi:nitroreductase family deazaflavin-dependent oxidoreductase [Candidatus Mycolicibacterium alkanivorans]|uniref:Nitroreductase family deazaflavin-dependent oxidoreductase n=1 Tax=Candidatus Mycolicibacterium alkanivorans TaxID=2954114 RepID=A0ABS9YYE3_9MYCO|nr:nitroreductase family deazaflavin-dependent oxidoreductase [Candidatus Mycolicibacterium alkanivorans]MCI4676256.1 nitroreductase family deazaflavin-dependent oxidoreductase [Candidatus Mycolicibacterium alkanivorans]
MTIPWRYPADPLRRWLFRLPVAAYRLGMGRLMGGWPITPEVRMGILLMTTVGRTSRRPRTTALEYRERGGRFFLVSAWGRRADWFKNIEHDPHVRVQAGKHRVLCRARALTSAADRDEAFDVWLCSNPRAAARFFRLIGLHLPESADEQRQLFEQFVAVVLEPEWSA